MNLSPVVKSQFLAFLLLGLLLISGNVAWAWTPNSQEQAVATFLTTDPNQHRPYLVFDPILAEVARARAADMAARGYLAHVTPDGTAANYLVSHAGYALPAWWGTDRSANYIESLGGGYATPQEVWTAWMNSPDHRTHLLALDSGGFFAQETHYGIGYVNVPGSSYGTYWVVITAPPAGIYVTSPDGGTQLNTDGIQVTGTAATDLGIANISVDIVNQSGTSTPILASGTKDWSINVQGLSHGLNTIQILGKDVNDAVVSQTSIDLTYVQLSPLVVTVSGSGSVTASLSGTTTQQVGASLMVTATSAKGYIFTGWTGGIQSASSQLKFVMQQDLALQANFIPNPFPTAKGAYTGLLSSGTQGYLSLNLNSTGAFSGKLLLGTSSYGFSGKFSALGQADLSIKRTGTTPLSLHVNLALDGSQEITGTVTDGSVVSNFVTDLATFGKANPAPEAGNYTIVFRPTYSGTTNPPSPNGSGVATLKLNASGVAAISGQLADNSRFSFTSNLSKNGTLPIYVLLPGRQGLLAGSLTFENLPGSDASGNLLWTKFPSLKNVSYAQGFSLSLDATASLYVVPNATTGFTVNAIPSAQFLVVDGLESVLIDSSATVATSGTIQFTTPPPYQLRLSQNLKTGAISGSFLDPSTQAKRTIQAVYLQKQGAAYGFFTGGANQGAVSLEASTP